MEYVFGTKKNGEILRTKGRAHSGLKGYIQAIREYPDQTVTDNFRVVRKYQSAKDAEGNCYDWYEIDHHYRYVDKATPKLPGLMAGMDETQDALCEASGDFEARIGEIEDALCELTEE
jgi:hypothetical protein